jgi:hypothetical protein
MTSLLQSCDIFVECNSDLCSLNSGRGWGWKARKLPFPFRLANSANSLCEKLVNYFSLGFIRNISATAAFDGAYFPWS